jgi:autotransporter-associated beta strand protein
MLPSVTNATCTDASPTDGSIYSYFVTATSAGGTSGNSTSAVAVPLPAPPASAPASLTGSYSLATSNVLLNWSAVSGAVGYIIRQGTSANGPFGYVENVSETTYTDTAVTPGTYYYTVTAVNAAGVSTNVMVKVVAPPAAPASLTAVAGDSQIILTWSSVANATGYVLKRGTSSSNETTTVIANYSGTSYTNTGLANGTTYYYVVAATNAGGLGPNSPEASATPSGNIVVNARNLTWKGDGAANVWDVSGAANWLSNMTATAFNNGDAVTFDNTGSNNVAVALNGTLLPALTTFNASKNYAFDGSGSIAGTNILVKSGAGTLTITATNTYSGGTILSNGIVALSGPAAGGVTANNFALGTGAINFEGGTLQLYGYNLADNTSSYGSMTNDIVVYGGQSGTIFGGPRYTLGSKITGSGTLNLNVDYVRGDISGDWSGFTGWLNVRSTSGTPTGTGSDDFRVATAAGFPNARVALGTNVFMYSRATAGSTIPIGEFSSAASVGVSAGGGSSAGTQFAVTWRVGGLNTDATNAAIFQGTTALIKEGTGAWTLTGASTHTGATTVNNGLLVVNGSFNGSSVTVFGGGLGGGGVISGAAVVVNSGATLAPGPTAGFGILTISNNLTLAAGSTMFVPVQHSPLTNAAVKISGTLFAGGTLIVTNSALDLTNGDSFKLFITPNFSGAFTNLILPPLADGLVWNTNALKISGTLSVAALAPPTIGGLALTGTSLTGSGSGGIPYWTYYVLTSTNLTFATPWTPVATNQFDVGGNFLFTNTIAPGQPQTFFRLQLQ